MGFWMLICMRLFYNMYNEFLGVILVFFFFCIDVIELVYSYIGKKRFICIIYIDVL